MRAYRREDAPLRIDRYTIRDGFLLVRLISGANRRFQFQKRAQLFICAHNETLSVVYESRLNRRWLADGERSVAHLINDFSPLYHARRFVIECPAPSTTIFLAMKNSIIFISALSLVAMMLASCNSIPSAFAPDETATTGVTRQTNETPRERSAEDSVNSISGGAY
jgi:hypothetical protein